MLVDKTCEECGDHLVTGDSSYYCQNTICKLYDIDIDAYEGDGVKELGWRQHATSGNTYE